MLLLGQVKALQHINLNCPTRLINLPKNNSKSVIVFTNILFKRIAEENMKVVLKKLENSIVSILKI